MFHSSYKPLIPHNSGLIYLARIMGNWIKQLDQGTFPFEFKIQTTSSNPDSVQSMNFDQ